MFPRPTADRAGPELGSGRLARAGAATVRLSGAPKRALARTRPCCCLRRRPLGGCRPALSRLCDVTRESGPSGGAALGSAVLASRAPDGLPSVLGKVVWPRASQAAVQSAGKRTQVTFPGLAELSEVKDHEALGLGEKNGLEHPPHPT